MTERTDEALYQRAKAIVIKREPKHSAYRSIRIAQQYKKMFADKYGKNKKPYKGDKSKSKLYRWIREKWTNEKGGTGYNSKSKLYRPSVRISKDTPITWGELSKKEIARAKREKKKTGRVKRFRK